MNDIYSDFSKLDFSITEIIQRIKYYKNLEHDYQVAELLGLTKTALAERKRRNSLPDLHLASFCEKESVNFYWLLTGHEPRNEHTIAEAKLYEDTFGISFKNIPAKEYLGDSKKTSEMLRYLNDRGMSDHKIASLLNISNTILLGYRIGVVIENNVFGRLQLLAQAEGFFAGIKIESFEFATLDTIDRLSYLVEKGVTDLEIADQLGVTLGLVSRFHAGKGISRDIVVKIFNMAKAKGYVVRLHEKPSPPPTPTVPIQKEKQKQTEKIVVSTQGIPVLSPAMCTKWLEAAEKTPPTNYADSFEPASTTDPDAFYIRAIGESMMSSNIDVHDLLLIEPSKKVESGDLVLVLIPDKEDTDMTEVDFKIRRLIVHEKKLSEELNKKLENKEITIEEIRREKPYFIPSVVVSLIEFRALNNKSETITDFEENIKKRGIKIFRISALLRKFI